MIAFMLIFFTMLHNF